MPLAGDLGITWHLNFAPFQSPTTPRLTRLRVEGDMNNIIRAHNVVWKGVARKNGSQKKSIISVGDFHILIARVSVKVSEVKLDGFTLWDGDNLSELMVEVCIVPPKVRGCQESFPWTLSDDSCFYGCLKIVQLMNCLLLTPVKTPTSVLGLLCFVSVEVNLNLV